MKGMHMADTLSTDAQAELKDLEKKTKRGFDLSARLKGRGLRHGTITVFLDEEKGVELGWAFDKTDALGNVVSREREGAIGELDAAVASRDQIRIEFEAKAEALDALDADEAKKTREAYDSVMAMAATAISELETKVADLTAELTKSALVIKMKAVPPVIEKDCRRLAKDKLEITTKGIPTDLKEEFATANTAFLMTKIIESITDNETGGVIVKPGYDDAIDLIDQLPPGQYTRLDQALGRIQFTDAISRSIEGQEDFS